MKGFKQDCNIIRSAFFKAHSGYRVETGLESSKSKAREAIRRSLQCPGGTQ